MAPKPWKMYCMDQLIIFWVVRGLPGPLYHMITNFTNILAPKGRVPWAILQNLQVNARHWAT